MKRFRTLLAAVALVSTACGGNASSDGVASLQDDEGTIAADDEATEVDSEQAMLDFAACMREHGVDMEDPTMSGDGGFGMAFGGVAGREGGAIDFEAMREAQEACSEYLENVTRDFEALDMTEMQDQMYEYAECMRENGYDMGDPSFTERGPSDAEEDGGIRVAGPFGDIDPDDPDFLAAQEACQDIFGGMMQFGPRDGGRPDSVAPSDGGE